MNRGLLGKALREAWLQTLLFALALGAFEAILAAVLPSFYEELHGEFLRYPFIQNLLRGLLGTRIGAEFGPSMLLSFAWVHPVALALLWAHEIVFCTRLPVSEIDRGTVDILLSLPVSRGQAFRSESLVWLGSGVIIITFGLAGNLTGSLAAGSEPAARPGRLLLVGVNLFCLYLAVGGFAYLVSASSSRRGRAVGMVFAVVLISFFLRVLGQFWAPAESFAFLSVLHYYGPNDILQTGVWPLADMAVLGMAGALLWVAAGVVFARRDICTV